MIIKVIMMVEVMRIMLEIEIVVRKRMMVMIVEV